MPELGGEDFPAGSKSTPAAPNRVEGLHTWKSCVAPFPPSLLRDAAGGMSSPREAWPAGPVELRLPECCLLSLCVASPEDFLLLF